MIDTSESLAGPRGVDCEMPEIEAGRLAPPTGVGVRPFSEVDPASPAERSGRRGSFVCAAVNGG
jgi:hypothetical protein